MVQLSYFTIKYLGKFRITKKITLLFCDENNQIILANLTKRFFLK